MESEPDEESRDSQVIEHIDFVRVDLDENYIRAGDGDSSSPSLNSNAVKGKYYKQTYRTAWEQMPDFKGWLRGVQGEPTRAYCTYCQKTLHAHRLSLLKHTCTIRHQKAAQLHNTRKVKALTDMEKQDAGSTSSNVEDDTETNVEYTDQGSAEGMEDGDGDHEIEQEEEDDEPEAVALEIMPVQFQKQVRQQVVPMGYQRPPISTHVLDTSKGHPVAGLQVSLYKLIDGRWTYINEGITNPDGRFVKFIERNDFTVGRYKLHYDVDRYFEARKTESLYPFIEIVFDCRTPVDHYHIPLLLSPYGYTTYRGT